MRVIDKILDLARWAPSGDNTQPWQFEVMDENHVVVHGLDTRDHCVYDLDGRPSQLAVGALLETLSLAATAHCCRAHINRRPDTPDTHLLFDVHLETGTGVNADPLARCIETRTVQRRAMSSKPLTAEQKGALEQTLPTGYKALWFERWNDRGRIAKLCFDNAKIRLTIPEAYEVHRAVIEWGARYSADKVPDQAVGADALNLKLMQWAMSSWERVDFFNTWLLGHLMPRVQMDLIPGVCCAAHFALLAAKPVQTVDDYITAGRAMQRFWLTATSLGLYIQPEMTPLIFARYHRQHVHFTRVKKAQSMVVGLDMRLRGLLGDNQIATLFFMGRMGTGPAPWARSIRKPLESMIVSSR
jgi:nitroreductase